MTFNILDLRKEGLSWAEISKILDTEMRKAQDAEAEDLKRRNATKTEVRKDLCDALAIYANEVLEIPCDAETRDRLEDMLKEYEKDIKSLLEYATREGNTFTIKNTSRIPSHFIRKLIF